MPSWVDMIKRSTDIKIRRAITQASTEVPNIDINPVWIKDAQKKNFTSLKLDVIKDMTKKHDLAKARRNKLAGK